MKKIKRIQEIVITPQDVVARLVEYEDESGAIHTFFRPHRKWYEGGLDVDTFIISPTVNEYYLMQAGYTKEEMDLVFEGFNGTDLD